MRNWKSKFAAVSIFALAGLSISACSGSAEDKHAPLAQPRPCVKTITPSTSESVAEVKPVDNGPVPAVSAGTNFGEKPSITPGEGPAPKDFIRKVLVEGTGTEVSANADVIVNYLGQKWDGEIFDNSWDRGQTASFNLKGVVSGWRWGLAGARVGDRVELVIPPALGYGELTEAEMALKNEGQELEGHRKLAGETLVFVVDIVFSPPVVGESQLAAYTQLLSKSTPTGEELPKGLRIFCEPGQEPQPAYVEGSKVPDSAVSIWTLEGKGAEIKAGDEIGFVVVSGSWGDKPNSTWTSGQGVIWLNAQEAGAVGKTVGSRKVIVGAPNEQVPRGLVQIVDIVAAVPVPTTGDSAAVTAK